jgi:hypothetical protein
MGAGNKIKLRVPVRCVEQKGSLQIDKIYFRPWPYESLEIEATIIPARPIVKDDDAQPARAPRPRADME